MVLAAVTGEDGAVRVGVEDVGAHLHEAVVRPRKEAHVDAAHVVALDQHRLRVRRATDRRQHRVVQHHQTRPVVGLDDGRHIGTQLLEHPSCVRRRRLVDGDGLELDPADPVGAPVGDQHDRALPWPAYQLPTHLAQHHVGPFVGPQHTQGVELVEDLVLDAGVAGQVEQLGDPRVGSQDLLASGGVTLAVVHRLRSGEQVLDVERREPHGSGRRDQHRVA